MQHFITENVPWLVR